ncbi:hypothetical protein [Nannocystis sp. SCPEA4]|uniref:hypothetical protein n=1 Tax=Nannocystis sp. SCPEA4 TaxID=2996787 RepID=UPI00226FA8AE|nr:hypothetical protein [Nannocystis sp. SCPEA4]MCY1058878.1 hypothetical protein [Nannocystis sp. SCPEA4]
MLWSEITKIVTRDGKTFQGVGVRDWLKLRGVLPDDDVSDSVAIEVDRTDHVVLRTRDEVRRWLLDAQLCSTVELARPPVGDPHNRQGARGGQVNRNDLPMRVEFVRAIEGTAFTTTSLVQGERLRVGVRLSPAPRQSKKTVELAFTGAKCRVRDAIRSVIAPTSGYRYLSRVRVARHVNGIQDPLPGMTRAFYSRAYPKRNKGADSYRIEEFTLLGLEAGVERIQASVVNPDGSLECFAVLEVNVSLAPNGVGAFRVFHNITVDDFKAGDPEFAEIHQLAPNGCDEVRVGVCDTGTYDDSAGDNYLGGHWIAGKYFGADLAGAQDRDTKPGGNNQYHILDYRESPSTHGTNVAGQAVWGTPNIKLVDVMIQRSQEMGASVIQNAAAAAERAFTWARQQGVAVVNCSKVVPFRVQTTHAVVSDPTTTSEVLFLATGGNSDHSFTLNQGHPKAANSEITFDNLPTAMVNTLWGGGCRRDRTPHEKRGHGPAIEVMVPSDAPQVYSPRLLRRAFRLQLLNKFHRDLIGELDGLDNGIANPPQTIAGTLTASDQEELDALTSDRPSGGFTGQFGGLKEKKYQVLVAKIQPQPNPDYYNKDAYHKAAALLRSWTIDRTSEETLARTLMAWASNVLQLLVDVKEDSTVTDHYQGLAGVQGPGRDTLYKLIRDRVQLKNLGTHREELAKLEATAPNISSDDGVSFGLPVVSNIAAKLKLINDTLTANQLKRILIDTSDIDPGFENQCIARGIVNPLRAYLAAFDGDVSTGGRLHHDFAPVKSSLPENRRVYYTFFYMDAQGLAVYDAIKDRLRAAYRDVDIDLVEAEPPILIKSEPVTYIEGRTLLGYNWRSIIPVKVHPLAYAKRHLRLVLVNQAAMVEGSKMSAVDTQYTVTYDTGTSTWTPVPVQGGKVVVTDTFLLQTPEPRWFCAAKLDDAQAIPAYSFALNPQHVITRFAVLDDADIPVLDERREPYEYLNISRQDRTVMFSITDPQVNAELIRRGRKITIEFGVIRRVGGSWDRLCNIFVNNSYHAGPSGTQDANDSVLVLFKHEIGHALGMVPSTGHTNYYRDKVETPAKPTDGLGGDGEHCAHNTETRSNNEAPGFGVAGDGLSGYVKVPKLLIDPVGHANAPPCVMYHTRTAVHHKSVFCDECKRLLSSSTLEKKWDWTSE